MSVSVTKVEKSSLTFWLRRSEKSRKNPKLQDCQCLIPNGHNQLRVYRSATDSGATHWSHFARRITSWGDPLGQIVKKRSQKQCFFACNVHKNSKPQISARASIRPYQWRCRCPLAQTIKFSANLCDTCRENRKNAAPKKVRKKAVFS